MGWGVWSTMEYQGMLENLMIISLRKRETLFADIVADTMEELLAKIVSLEEEVDSLERCCVEDSNHIAELNYQLEIQGE